MLKLFKESVVGLTIGGIFGIVIASWMAAGMWRGLEAGHEDRLTATMFQVWVLRYAIDNPGAVVRDLDGKVISHGN